MEIMLKKTNLSETVKNILKNKIINNELSQGKRIHLVSLSNELGVSGTPVREALHKLEREGLLKNIPNRGFFVTEIKEKDVREIFQIREALEVLAIRLSTPLFTKKDIDTMENLMKKSKLALKNNNRQVFINCDRVMHSLIIQRSGNKRLSDIIENLSDFVHALRIRKISGLKGRERVHLAIQEHEALLEAIKEKDIEKASMTMSTHLKCSLEYYLEHLSEISQDGLETKVEK
jgi:DNA-binding GntR family transcriptional regulator